MKPYCGSFVNSSHECPSKVDFRWVWNPFESAVSPCVLSHAPWGMTFIESSPSTGILTVSPRFKAFAVTCLHRRGRYPEILFGGGLAS